MSALLAELSLWSGSHQISEPQTYLPTIKGITNLIFNRV